VPENAEHIGSRKRTTMREAVYLYINTVRCIRFSQRDTLRLRHLSAYYPAERCGRFLRNVSTYLRPRRRHGRKMQS